MVVRDGILIGSRRIGRVTRASSATVKVGRRSEVAEAYCVRDKQKVEIKDPQQVTMKNGKSALKGTCPNCGGSVFRIGG